MQLAATSRTGALKNPLHSIEDCIQFHKCWVSVSIE
jgi:hypothetical protein